MKRRPTPEEIMEWWGVNVNGANIHEIYGKSENRYGVGIVCGSASGGLVAVEISNTELFKALFLSLSRETAVSDEGFVPMTYYFMGRTWVMRNEGVAFLFRIKGNSLTRVPFSTFNGTRVLGEGSFIVAPPSTISEKYEAEWRADITNPIASVPQENFEALLKAIKGVAGSEGTGKKNAPETKMNQPERKREKKQSQLTAFLGN